MEQNDCNDFGFAGPHTILHHQYFRMAGMMIESYECTLKRMNSHLNLCTNWFAPPIDNKWPEAQMRNLNNTEGTAASTVEAKNNSNVSE